MSQIVKSYLGIFLILLMILTSMGILSGYLQVMEAQNFHAQMISEMEESNFYPSVIQSCFENANQKGYILAITLYQEDGGIISLSPLEPVLANTAETDMAEVVLNYTYSIPFLSISQKHRICGYAR